MTRFVMLASLLSLPGCKFPNPQPEPGEGEAEAEAEGECGECRTDADCADGEVCATCEGCDPATGVVCEGICGPGTGGSCGDGVCDPNTAGAVGENCETCPKDCGECEPQGCGGIAGIPCPPGYECVDDPSDDCDPATGADCGGICVPDDCVCPTVWDPVCGADGITYANQCEADCAGVEAACEGECPCSPDGCGDGVCDPSTAGALGENCENCPEDCGDCCEPADEVCGDGIDNDCDGAIDEDCPLHCGGIAGIPCPPGYECVDDPNDECDPSIGAADCSGICVPSDDCVCPTLWDPVCGVDGITYSNQCEADCAGVTAACEGECPCAPGSCGDGVCDPGTAGTVGETCENCPADCGDCGGCDPSAAEICGDGIDNDCDGAIDEDCGCGGFGGIPCPTGYECVDDPSDDCDPAAGGADCPGICVPL